MSRGVGFDDWFTELLGRSVARDGQPTTRTKMAARQVCAKDGHQYRVHGKITPTKIQCGRCDVSWAIGPRTEPS